MATGSGIKCCGVATCLLFLTLLVLLPSQSSAASHFEAYSVAVTSYSYNCYPYTYTYCYNWYYWNYWYYGWYWGPYYNYYYWYYWNPYYGYYSYWPCCYYRTWYDCYWRSYTSYVTQYKCQSGWSGSNCDVPICTPACTGGQVCVDVNKCSCINGAGVSCSIVPCSTTSNCYPGTCNTGTSTCKCPAGFNGTNCDQITQKPSLTNCKVQLYAKSSDAALEVAVAVADCAAEGLEPRTTWVGKDGLNTGATNYGLTKIEPVWTAEYTFPFSMPARPAGATSFFISNAPVAIGIGKAWYNVTFGSTTVTPGAGLCIDSSTTATTVTTVPCDKPTPWNNLNLNSLLQDNASFTVNMMAYLGGHKDGDSTYQYNGASYGFGSQTFTGIAALLQAKFQFDITPPSHCLLETDISEVEHSNCTAFPISLDQDIRTNPVIEPKFLNWTDKESGIGRYVVQVFFLAKDANDLLVENGDALTTVEITPYLNNFQYTVPRVGVYSIILTTYDRANNSAKARKIFNFNDKPSFITTNAPVYFQEADPASNYSYIKDLPNRDRLTLKWTGRFRNAEVIDEVLSKRVKPWPISPTTAAIDDNFGTKFGMRSINALSNATGISSMDYCYTIDTKGGIGAQPPQDNTSCHSISSSDRAAESITLTFDPPLKDGQTVVLWLTTMGATGTANLIKVQTFIDASRVNVTTQMLSKNAISTFTSLVIIYAVDKESGINSTYYEIFEATTKVLVSSGYAPATKRDAPSVKRAISLPCYPDDNTCYCTPARLCFDYQQKIEIDHCLVDRYSGGDYKLQFKYRVSNLAGIVTDENILELGDVTGLACRTTPATPGMSDGAKAGIAIGSIIGFLVLACLIALVILMVVRVVQHKHPVPDRMRTVAHNVRNRLTMRYASRPAADNAVYVGAEPPPKYPGPSKGYGRGKAAVDTDDIYLDSDGLNANKITRKQVQMADTLAEGKFAIVRKAYLEKDTGREVVAAKALRNGFGRSDELLMSKKIAFMRDVTPHANIVRFMGAVDECGPEGPIMLLELCETTLKDWLANMRSISTDDLEMMLVFTLNIARGVEHLHSLKIIHRRLAVRNILLKQQANGLVAKLIGFGPTAEDVNDRSDGAGAGAGAAVPIKWMAPETLDTLGSKKPTYNEKTDAWSYGVTIWEMYSKGAAPYSDVKSADVKAMIKRGHRLSCPNDCPPDLFSSVVTPCWADNPKQRPAFSAIGRTVDEFRMGSGPQEGYYAADEARGGGGGYGGRAPEELYADGM